MSPAHTLTRAVAAVALLAALAGCSAAHHQDANPTGGASSTRLGPGDGPDSPSPTGSVAQPSAGSTTSSGASPDSQNLADWPSEPADGTKVPEFRSQVIKPGYTGESYLNRLAASWGITMEARQKIEFPGRPDTWHTSGSKQSGETRRTIAALWSLDGDLILLSCFVAASDTERAEFLHACASLDHPEAAPAATRTWLDAMVPQVDGAFASGKKGAVIDSPLHRSGPVATVLQKAHDTSRGGDYYQLYSFGTGAS